MFRYIPSVPHQNKQPAHTNHPVTNQVMKTPTKVTRDTQTKNGDNGKQPIPKSSPRNPINILRMQYHRKNTTRRRRSFMRYFPQMNEHAAATFPKHTKQSL